MFRLIKPVNRSIHTLKISFQSIPEIHSLSADCLPSLIKPKVSEVPAADFQWLLSAFRLIIIDAT
ncbi:hypothetical protein [Peribacillus frigoritolerans]|uniref:hypothetical protein n=1 Tax=Peribacillus frigoritolerans TaxID=450367 RepID=UPI00227E1CD8|nr:hypothetical protein [Peribacillus frigoritolerans]MCY8937160.1 hypothetical protein [Peribacillus frigoritolerans]